MTKKKKYVIFIFGILFLSLLVIGATFAYLMLSVDVTNGRYAGVTDCMIIDYDITNDDGNTSSISGTLFQSSTPKGGLSGKVTMNINSTCTFSSLPATINLNVDNSTSSLLLSEGALKYAVYENDGSQSVSEGVITTTGNITIYQGFNVTQTLTSYYIYIWLDGNIADNEYVNLPFSGYVIASAQNESVGSSDAGEAFAIYSISDNSLRFYKNEDVDAIQVGGTYNNKTVTQLYTGIESLQITSDTEIPWGAYKEDITSVTVEDGIKPIDTSYWFYSFENCSSFNLSNLNTSNVRKMSYMFDCASFWATSAISLDLSHFNTSKVTDMRNMFNSMAQEYGVTITGLTNWDTSNVTNMSYMFNTIQLNNQLDLSAWNVTKVTNHENFGTSGYLTPPVWD